MESRAGDREVMVPLTSSLYVPGIMQDNRNVLVEVGAGYFIERNTEDASGYCDRKIKNLQESSTKVGQLIQAKQAQAQRVNGEYEKRVKAMQEQMAAAQAAKQ